MRRLDRLVRRRPATLDILTSTTVREMLVRLARRERI
jgi:hypothetical protein